MKFLDETGLKFIATKFKELRDSLSGYAKKEDVPTSLSQLKEDENHKFITAEEKRVFNLKNSGYYATSVFDFEELLANLVFLVADIPDINLAPVFNFIHNWIPKNKDFTDPSKSVEGYDKLRFSGMFQKNFAVIAQHNEYFKKCLLLKHSGDPFTPEELGELLIHQPEGGDYRCWVSKPLYEELSSKYTASHTLSYSNKIFVKKEDGKQLSTNDYTNEAKAKVDAIPENPKYTDTVQDLSGYLKKSDVFNNKTFNGDESKLSNIPFSAQQGVWLWARLDRVAPNGELDLSKMVTKISIQDREPYPDNELQGLLLSGALDELFLRTTKLNERKVDKKEIKTKLSEMTDDATHRLVTDAEKTAWNNKLDSISGKDISRSKTKGYNTSNTWSSLSTNRDLEDWIGDFDKRTRENKDALSKYKQQVILTQSEYDKLSSTDKNDASKIYFIKA